MPAKKSTRAPKSRGGPRREKTVRELLLAVADIIRPDATLLDAIDSLLEFAAIEQGLADIRAGRTIPHDEVFRRMEAKRAAREKSAGRTARGRASTKSKRTLLATRRRPRRK